MKKALFPIFLVIALTVTIAYAGFLDDILKGAGGAAAPSGRGTDSAATAAGLKEAFTIGSGNVSKVDGYLKNEIIKILMPEKIRKVADVLSNVGYKKEVDSFVMSMNRAAEKAAPKAASYFVDAIKEMSFDDARKILAGGDTSATEFFKQKTYEKLHNAFKPIISASMNEVGTTRSYKQMMSKYESIPFMDKQSVDLDHYVTNKSLDGLFYMIGQEEKNIRTNPAARVTDLLKTVFRK